MSDCLEECIEELTRAMEFARQKIEQTRQNEEEEEFVLSAWSTDDEANQPEKVEVQPNRMRSSNLAVLESMGFHDVKLNQKLLKRMKGNIDAVIEKLLDMASPNIDETRSFSNSSTEGRFIGPSTSKPRKFSADMDIQIDFRKLISFLQGRKSGQDLISSICDRYKIVMSDNSPDHILHQVALSCIFDPALEDFNSGEGTNLRPNSLMDVEDVKRFKLTFVQDESGVVKWLQVDALVADEHFRAVCIACSHCGSSFSGRVIQSPDASIDASWTTVEKSTQREPIQQRKRGAHVHSRTDLRICTFCFIDYSSNGSLVNAERTAVEKVPEMFPEGAATILSRSNSKSCLAQSSKRKRTTTSRWDPEDYVRTKRAQVESRAHQLRAEMTSRAGPISVLNSNAVSNEEKRFCESLNTPSRQASGSPMSQHQNAAGSEEPCRSASSAASATLRLKNAKCCQVCFDDSDGEYLPLCDICNVSVHKSCYMGENEEIDHSVGWRCNPCKRGIDFCTTTCRVCPVKGGAFKRIFGASNDWVHLPCAIWVPGLYVENEVTMELVKGIDNIEPGSFGKVCCICMESSGCTIGCNSQGCKKRWHPMCGLGAGWQMRISVENETGMALCKTTTLCSEHAASIRQETGRTDIESIGAQQPVVADVDELQSADNSDLCSCQVPWDGVAFMIQCDWCEIWYHGTCVGVQEKDVATMDTFVCVKCRPAKSSEIGQNAVTCSPSLKDNLMDCETNALIHRKSESPPQNSQAGTELVPIPVSSSEMAVNYAEDTHTQCVDEEAEECDAQSVATPELKKSRGFSRKLSLDQARFILDQRPVGEAEHRRAAPDVWRRMAVELSSKFGVSPQAIFNIWEGRRWVSIASKSDLTDRGNKATDAADKVAGAENSDNAESTTDIGACMLKFLASLLDEVVDGEPFMSTELLLDKFKKLVSSEGGSLPSSFQQLSSFGRHLKSVDGMVRKKVSGLSGFEINATLLQSYLSCQEGSIPPVVAQNDSAVTDSSPLTPETSCARRPIPKRSLSKALGTSQSDPHTEDDNAVAGTDDDQESGADIDAAIVKPKMGLRVLYKWSDKEWYEGTIGKNKAKASYYNSHLKSKRSDWWSVTWDDGATSLILLSADTKSNWHVFHADGPKPALYEKLPLVLAGSRHGVTGERIVREKNPISPIAVASASSSPAEKRKSNGVKNSMIKEGDESEILSDSHVAEFSPVTVICEGNGNAVYGVMKKEGKNIIIKHKGSSYNMNQFARLVCTDQDFSAKEIIKIRETRETLQKFLDKHNPAAADLSRTDSGDAKRSSTGETRSVGTHFFDEETPG